MLQNDLTKIVNWYRKNNMALNVNKCAIMSTTHSRDKMLFPYSVENNLLKRVNAKKHLE